MVRDGENILIRDCLCSPDVSNLQTASKHRAQHVQDGVDDSGDVKNAELGGEVASIAASNEDVKASS